MGTCFRGSLWSLLGGAGGGVVGTVMSLTPWPDLPEKGASSVLIFRPSLFHVVCRNERQESSLWFVFRGWPFCRGSACTRATQGLSPKAWGPLHDPGPFSGRPAGAPDQCGILAEVLGLQKRGVTCPEPSLCGSLVKGYCTASHWEASTGPTVFLTQYWMASPASGCVPTVTERLPLWAIFSGKILLTAEAQFSI